MRKIQLFIDGQRLDLFGDETISLTSTVQNIADISKTFSDFTQSFSVPASKNNNKVLRHWYNSDINNGFDARTRKEARLEIDSLPFRSGKIELTDAIIEDNEPVSYALTFYGLVVTLKDKFSTLKLSDLDFSHIQFEYTAANVRNTLTDTATLPVRFPLISSKRIWQYGVPHSISTITGDIKFTELFPAVRDRDILTAIETSAGVTFDGTFIDSQRFSNSYTWLKNEKTFSAFTAGNFLDFATTPEAPWQNGTYYNYRNWLRPYLEGLYGPVSNISTQASVEITTTGGVTYVVDIYENGEVVNTYISDNSASQSFVVMSLRLEGVIPTAQNVDANGLPEPDTVPQYTVKVRNVSGPTTLTGFMTMSGFYDTALLPANSYVYKTALEPYTYDGKLDIQVAAPKQLVSEWFAGLLKQYNLTIDAQSETEYTLKTLQNYYAGGDRINITEDTSSKKTSLSKPNIYSHLAFEYSKTKAFLNVKRDSLAGTTYGNLISPLGYDGAEKKISLPFETLLFNKFTGTDLQVSYCLEDETDVGSSFIPSKPVKLSLYAQSKTVSFYFEGVEVTSYIPFGQDTRVGGKTYSQNFNSDNSSLELIPIEDSLYKNFYENYLVNLYSQQNRLVKIDTVLPISKLLKLDLSDVIILKDNQYIINSYNTNLNTGQTKFELLHDFTERELDIDWIYLSTALTSSTNLRIQTHSGGDWLVDWGDGTVEQFTSSTTYRTHNYLVPYSGDIKISAIGGVNDFDRMYSSTNKFNFDISSLPSSLAFYINTGQNTTSGLIDNLPSSLTYYLNYGNNTTSGLIDNLPSGLTYYNNRGNNTVSDYTSGHIFANNLERLESIPTSGGLSTTEVDNLLIDLDTSITVPNGSRLIKITGTNAPRSTASGAAVISLINKGYTVTTNP